METYKRLFTSWSLKGFPIKNRIGVPPLVIYTWSDDTGHVVDKEVEHYRALVNGGAGLVMQEATSVSRAGRLTLDQLGIWEDGQIPGLRCIVDVLHSAGMPAILQLSHAGILAAGAPENQVSPSAYRCFGNGKDRIGRKLTIPEIHEIEQQFIDAARRAAAAGYDGAELHCCHGYLLSEFLNSRMNRRTDEYHAAGRLILKRIITGIRAVTPPSFILGIRLGAFEPGLAEGVANAQWLEAQGMDFIDVYVGCDWAMDPETPKDYPFRPSIYGAKCIRQAVSIPVFAAHGIHTGPQAEAVLEDTGADLAVIGRSSLVNPSWGSDVKAGRDPGRCLECPNCMWQINPDKCPGMLLLKKERTGRP